MLEENPSCSIYTIEQLRELSSMSREQDGTDKESETSEICQNLGGLAKVLFMRRHIEKCIACQQRIAKAANTKH